ncbi:MAG: hypothetical protein ACKVOU_13410 [Cytophagales bacterium]
MKFQRTAKMMVLILLIASCSSKSKLITHKWLVSEAVISEQKLSGELVSGFFLDLKEDGNYTLSGMSTERGVWQLSESKDSLITINEDKRKVAYFIKELTNESLVLYDNTLGTEMITSFKK